MTRGRAGRCCVLLLFQGLDLSGWVGATGLPRPAGHLSMLYNPSSSSACPPRAKVGGAEPLSSWLGS